MGLFLAEMKGKGKGKEINNKNGKMNYVKEECAACSRWNYMLKVVQMLKYHFLARASLENWEWEGMLSQIHTLQAKSWSKFWKTVWKWVISLLYVSFNHWCRKKAIIERLWDSVCLQAHSRSQSRFHRHHDHNILALFHLPLFPLWAVSL